MLAPAEIGHNQPPAYKGRGGFTTNKFEEDQLQIAMVHCLKLDFLEKDLMFTHIPNGGRRDKRLITRGKNKGKWYSPEGAKLKAMGVLPGMSDLLNFWPGDNRMECGLIEIKTEDVKSVLSPEQKDVRRRVLAMNGRFAVARNYETLRETLVGWGVRCQYRVTFT